uniref:Uncharacterized protein n=1 Tax=Magallana gigas TaxID=29159 RepID=A0A8W8HY63_MAGGI
MRGASLPENEHRPTQATATDILLVDEDDAYREQLFPFPVNKEITVQSIPAVEPTATPSDHDYCSYGNEKAHPQTCNAECQTNLTLQDMEKSEAELLQLRETFRDKDDLKRYLLVDKMTDSDSSVKSYFGLPSVFTLFGIFAILDNLTPTLAYWKGL